MLMQASVDLSIGSSITHHVKIEAFMRMLA